MTDIEKKLTETPAPALTLTPDLTEAAIVPEAPAPVMVQQAAPEAQELDASTLSEEELRMVDEFANRIDVRDSATILQYGAGAQKKMADFPKPLWKRCARRIWVLRATLSSMW